MNYQAICAALEVPLNTAFAALSPPVKIFFDNLVVMSPDAPGEYVMVNITFGLTSETALEESLDRARGAIIIRVFVRKGNGARRGRQLSETASCVLRSLGPTKKSVSGAFVRVKDISGPAFYMDKEEPHFMARLTASWDATNLG